MNRQACAYCDSLYSVLDVRCGSCGAPSTRENKPAAESKAVEVNKELSAPSGVLMGAMMIAALLTLKD